MIENPRQWFHLLSFMLLTRQFLGIVWLTMIQLISVPGMVVLIVIRGLKVVPFKIGSLTALNKDGAGKRRIIAITDFWTQLAFRPLHDALFSMLKQIKQMEHLISLNQSKNGFYPVFGWEFPLSPSISQRRRIAFQSLSRFRSFRFFLGSELP